MTTKEELKENYKKLEKIAKIIGYKVTDDTCNSDLSRFPKLVPAEKNEFLPVIMVMLPGCTYRQSESWIFSPRNPNATHYNYMTKPGSDEIYEMRASNTRKPEAIASDIVRKIVKNKEVLEWVKKNRKSKIEREAKQSRINNLFNSIFSEYQKELCEESDKANSSVVLCGDTRRSKNGKVKIMAPVDSSTWSDFWTVVLNIKSEHALRQILRIARADNELIKPNK